MHGADRAVALQRLKALSHYLRDGGSSGGRDDRELKPTVTLPASPRDEGLRDNRKHPKKVTELSLLQLCY